MTQADRIWALTLLWAQAKETYPYFDRLTLDWDQAYREYLDQILEEEDDRAFYLSLCRFYRLLNDGHTMVLLPKAVTAPLGFFPFRFRHTGGRFIIAEAREEKHLLLEATAIDGIPLTEWTARLDQYQYTANGHPYFGRLESWLPLLLPAGGHILDTDAEEIPFHLPEQAVPLVQAPAPRSRHDARTVSPAIQIVDGSILCATVDSLTQTVEADRFLDTLAREKPKAVIFDIRRNIGGMTLCGAKYAQPFFTGKFSGCRKWTQQRSANDAAGASQLTRMSEERLQKMMAEGLLAPSEVQDAKAYAQRTVYHRYQDEWEFPGGERFPECPVILLTSRDTISAAEDFACFFKSNRRGTLLGEPTFGSTGSPLLITLPGGGRAQVVSVGYTMLDGTPFIGCGIQPDIPCPPDLNEWRQGIDGQLDRAVERLLRQL